ncbi:glycosyltransferase family 2 protein [Paraburkholderia sp. EG287A]|uniref:glycosyltransferase family 2 protein n=1 Tax=Paraburkholderia sp. EG287A TaxID=3237012 RepID=UPI0034D2F41A
MRALTIVVPARNEARVVGKVLRRLQQQFPDAELLLVNNGSTDDTEAVALATGCRVINEPAPGKGRAMLAGARAASNDWLLFHDADTEYETADAVQVVATAMLTGHCAIGVRMVAFDHVRPSSWLANRVIQWMLHRRYGVWVRDVLTGTRCMRRSLFLSLDASAKGFGIETQLTLGCIKRGVPIDEVPVRYIPRSKAQGKKIRAWHLWSLMRIAMS